MNRSRATKFSGPFKRLALSVALIGTALPAFADGLTRVEQKIFGMDCAPCAYGIESGLKRLSGVNEVRVSLNEGMATVTLNADSTTTIESIRKVVRDNGFTPKAAHVVVTGRVVRADGRAWLEVSGLPRYELTGATKAVQATLDAGTAGQIQLEGDIPESTGTAKELMVQSLTG